MPKKALLFLAFSMVAVIMMTAAGPEPPRVVKAWAAMMQAVKALEEYVATKELSAIHDEDATLAVASGVLQLESRPSGTGGQQALAGALKVLGQQLGDLHQAADASDVRESAARLKIVLATYARIKTFYGEDVLAPARRLAETFACPMHRDVVGQRTATCPRCGMTLDQPVRVQLVSIGLPPSHTVWAGIRTTAPLTPGKPVAATLKLGNALNGRPLLITDLRVVHTERIHLLIVDASLTDYHHVHPQATNVPGEFSFTFTPMKTGSYRAWADVRTTYDGFQEYAMTDIGATTKPTPLPDRRETLTTEYDKLRYSLMLETPRIVVNEPMRARLRLADAAGRPFAKLEPLMGTFAHLVAFHEDRQTVLHLHPRTLRPLTPGDRGGPTLDFQIYATKPGFYRLFAQVQIAGQLKFVPFGVNVAAAPPRS